MDPGVDFTLIKLVTVTSPVPEEDPNVIPAPAIILETPEPPEPPDPPEISTLIPLPT